MRRVRFTFKDNHFFKRMRIHDSLRAHRKLSSERRKLVSDQLWLGDGAYSRVLLLDDYRVIKLTSCTSTQRLLETLQQSTRQKVPSGLPAVFEDWGLCATDADGIDFRGYVVERLYRPEDIASQLRGRRGLGHIESRRPTVPRRPFSQRGQELLDLTAAMAAVRDGMDSTEQPMPCHLLATTLGLQQLPAEMRTTLEYLADFIRTTDAQLDLFQAGNVLVDCLGNPILCDPVADDAGHPATDSARGAPSCALVGLVMTAIDGLVVHARWDTLFAGDRQALLDIAPDLLAQQLSLAQRLVPYGSQEHEHLLSQPAQRRTIWSVPASMRQAFTLAHR